MNILKKRLIIYLKLFIIVALASLLMSLITGFDDFLEYFASLCLIGVPITIVLIFLKKL